MEELQYLLKEAIDRRAEVCATFNIIHSKKMVDTKIYAWLCECFVIA